MKRRDFIKTAGVATGAVAATAASSFPKPALSQNLMEWRMVTTWPKNFPGLGTGAEILAQMITAGTDGRLKVTVHGGGIFASPERFETLFRASVSRHCEVGFTGLFAGKITDTEVHDVLDGRLPDGTEIPVFSLDEIIRGITDLPRRYAVVMDFETAKRCKSGYTPLDDLKDDPLMIVRAGGVEAAAAYLNKVKGRHNAATSGNWHPFNSIDPEQAQTRVPFLAGNKDGVGAGDDDGHLFGYDAEYGMGGDSSIHNTSMINVARYVAVAPRNASTSVRNLPFGG